MNGFALNNIKDCKLGSTQVKALYLGNVKIWPQSSFYSDYFTVEMLESGTLRYYFPFWETDQGGVVDYSLMYVLLDCDAYYSKDNGNTWTQMSIPSRSTGYVSINVNANDVIIFKANNYTWRTYNPPVMNPPAMPSGEIATEVSCCRIYSTARHNVYGNTMSLLYGDNFASANTFLKVNYDSSYNNQYFNVSFRQLFEFDSGLVDASNLILPITDFVDHSKVSSGITYTEMFYRCTNMEWAPSELPATGLYSNSYYRMFNDCTSIIKSPNLPATTLAEACYNRMFIGCTSLYIAPILYAPTLTGGCYYAMFDGCSSLYYLKCLATDISAYNCTTDWLNNVAASGTFVKDANTTWPSGSSGIPSGWTQQNA